MDIELAQLMKPSADESQNFRTDRKSSCSTKALCNSSAILTSVTRNLQHHHHHRHHHRIYPSQNTGLELCSLECATQAPPMARSAALYIAGTLARDPSSQLRFSTSSSACEGSKVP
ncbi:hypothetical protein Mp_8g00410 [Marchantia polymorpha subsp. ruderalis]|uniref:Uncharacterized protein n=1 Tax=Marchantia polymorpha TaxID=3197 RepID=A0A2R6WLK3_MARPO|nr:hypothetical protein MARPO_0077s0032 [Marchantia polymorpha]BBN18182.1 hypothetical protein Mp_8g00410 [Marchantia polymorpha subsp. ruderalis]|eukprot:PTQ34703.1 hypothetical protein MARPO_0077s0032 [Marchantia polymorpha]